ncbi:phage tail protein, partial [Sphingorhabdus sp.]
SLGWRDIFRLGDVWNRAKRIFTTPITRIISFAKGLFVKILEFVQEAVLRPLAALAAQTPFYTLLKAVLGKDPVTGEAYEGGAAEVIGGFMTMIGQQELWQNIQNANAIPRAFAWFKTAMKGLMGLVTSIPTRFIDGLKSLEIMDFVVLPRAFAKIGAVLGSFLADFGSWALGTVLDLLKIIVEVVAPAVMPYIKKAAGAFNTILRNPIGFVRTLVRAAMLGFRQFATNFLKHLQASLVGWLTGAMAGANIYIPQGLNLREILKFVLSILGLTWANIRAKLVRATNETTVVALETGFDIVRTLVTEGPAAAWQKILEVIGNLKQMAIDAIMDFVKSRVVEAAVTRLLSMLTPAGAFIQAIIAIYNTIMFFVERLRQIAQVAASFIDAIATIASGNVGPAANRVESTMAGLLTLVISFLARIAGLGRVADAVTNLINRIRAPIDRALDAVVNWIVTQARRLGAAVMRGARGAVAAVAGWLGLRVPFTDDDGEQHNLYFGGNAANADLIVASAPESVSSRIARRRAATPAPNATERQSLTDAEQTVRQINNLTRPSGRPAADTTSLTPQLNPLMVSLARQLKSGGIFLNAPLSNVTYSMVGANKAGTVTANPLSSIAGNTRGSGTGSSNPPGWATVMTAGIANPSSYVRMHLLYHMLHGPGIAWNLVPAPQSVNIGIVHNQIEVPLETAVNAGATFNFTATAHYPTSGPLVDFPTGVTFNWTPRRRPSGVSLPSAPGRIPISPPVLTGAVATTAIDLNMLSMPNLQLAGLPQDLSRAIVRARTSGGFSSATNFKRRVDQALQSLFNPPRRYRDYQSYLIAKQTDLTFGTRSLSGDNLSWP